MPGHHATLNEQNIKRMVILFGVTKIDQRGCHASLTSFSDIDMYEEKIEK